MRQYIVDKKFAQVKINLAKKEEIKVGKAADNDVVLTHVTVEDHQCSILNG